MYMQWHRTPVNTMSSKILSIDHYSVALLRLHSVLYTRECMGKCSSCISQQVKDIYFPVLWVAFQIWISGYRYIFLRHPEYEIYPLFANWSIFLKMWPKCIENFLEKRYPFVLKFWIKHPLLGEHTVHATMDVPPQAWEDNVVIRFWFDLIYVL